MTESGIARFLIEGDLMVEPRVWTAEELRNAEPNEAWVDNAVSRISEILVDHHPADQGRVLAEMVAIWIRGHPPDVRDEIGEMWSVLVNGLVGLSDNG